VSPALSQSNADWSRDELILALELYMSHRDHLPDRSDPQVIELSSFLRGLTTQTAIISSTYRNLNGVYMKLGNFRAIDPAYVALGRKGLPAGSKGDRAVWAAFADRPDELRATAQAIRANASSLPPPVLAADDDIAEAEEGRILTRTHVTRERNRKLVQRKKGQALKVHGDLKCEACGFSFGQVYGQRGDGFIEAHHRVPLHQLRPGVKTRIEDLALLCANCHRMVHARSPWLSIDQLRAALKIKK
jgi:5-methylcytosine-specific restriction protein A